MMFFLSLFRFFTRFFCFSLLYSLAFCSFILSTTISAATTEANATSSSSTKTTQPDHAAIDTALNAPELSAIGKHYLSLGTAIYTDAIKTAESLLKANQELVKNPTSQSLKSAQKAYRLSRIPYQQSEAFRFANPEVDELEGRVNAWPLDEGLIDYVEADSYSRDHPLAKAHVIAQDKISVAGKSVNLKKFDKTTLRLLHEIDGAEGHVATGYHAIEFLLWGQDLNGYRPGSGQRPHSDYDTKNCTGGNCERRAEYLIAVSELLVSDLEEMARLFEQGRGAVYQRLSEETPATTVKNIFSGLASLAYGELAGERIQLGLLLNDPEEEHECFSDLTHLAHKYNVVGLENIYFGTYTDSKGKKISGPSLSAWAKKYAPDAAKNSRLISLTQVKALKLSTRPLKKA